MHTCTVVLTYQQSVFVEQMVSSGRYQDASEVLREGLRRLQRHEQEVAGRLALLRKAVQSGMDDIAAGYCKIFAEPQALGASLRSLAAQAIASPSP